MHELVIATAIADAAQHDARGRVVSQVEVKIGCLLRVVPGALDFSWGLVSEDSNLGGSKLILEEVPARGRCRLCGDIGPLTFFPIACGRCGGLEVQVTAGDEILIEALELLDLPRPGARPRSDVRRPAEREDRVSRV